ncbi:hypothetical protein H9L39_08352 [Fusarium oxysporum f. sp. albedinis]|nr:hypothetical protein H9L39_08352 [Fusarium oxysporum f. sp. albedinis]
MSDSGIDELSRYMNSTSPGEAAEDILRLGQAAVSASGNAEGSHARHLLLTPTALAPKWLQRSEHVRKAWIL